MILCFSSSEPIHLKWITDCLVVEPVSPNGATSSPVVRPWLQNELALLQCWVHFSKRSHPTSSSESCLQNDPPHFYFYLKKCLLPFALHFFISLQCCGAATFLGGSGSGSLRYRSRLRLRPNSVVYGSSQKKAAPAPYTNNFHFELLKSELLMQVFFGSHLPV